MALRAGGNLIRDFLQRMVPLVARIGSNPHDDDDIRLQKSLLVLCAFPFMFAGVFWGLLYIFANEPLAGAIPLGYAIISMLSIIYFGRTRQYQFFRFSQLTLILLLPFLLMVALGGFLDGSAVVLWALICPMGALLFDEPRHAPRWFLAFIILVVLSGLLEPYVRANNNLSPELVNFFFVINLIGVGSLVFMMVFYFVGQKNMFQQKSESLLLNILPKEIAAILKNESRTIADHYNEASVLFADMVGFTPLSARLPPVEMVELLNEVFSFFDSLLDKYNVEKIRTIGDSYMVASGVPRGRADHAQALAHMALEMRDHIATHTFCNGQRVNFRIGINSGSMIAGVIGKRKFVYDVWGDAVNIASRMESHGLGGAVQITRATYDLIKDDFVCEPRGPVNVKGKGEMEVWLVVSRKSEN
ncbi:MAG TPA: adenylate/guanylate cyclase domain-containing protein [Anaerolineales bacterium]|nr:adenylate/guanylate cyclase domain-containing protein [Anaerolineales bacterium]